MTVGSFPQDLDGLVRSEESVRRRELSLSLGRWAAGAVAAVAVVALLGWWIGSPLLKSAVPGLVSMNPLSAICFLLAAASLLLLCSEGVTAGERLFAQAGAASIVSIAFIALSRLYTPWDIGADLLLFASKVTSDAGGGPNRMAPNTGLSFVLIGLALALMDYRTRGAKRPSVALAAIAGVLSLIVSLGYVYDSRMLYGIGRFTPMAMNTAVCFLMLSLGIISARPGAGMTSLLTGTGPGSVLGRRLLPAVIALPIMLGWLRFKGEAIGLYDAGTGVALLATGTMLVMGALIWWSAVSLDRTDLARTRAELMLKGLNDALESRVTERTVELAGANEALLDQTRFLNQVIDTNPQFVFVKDWSGRFTLANCAVAELYGTTVGNLIGKTDADFNPNLDEVRAFVEADREVMSKRQIKVIPEERVTGASDGETRWLQTVKAPLIERDGSCNRVLGLSTDITARHHAEAELRRASDELRALFEASPLAICAVTADGYVRSWNPAAVQLFGWTADEVIGRTLPVVPPDLSVQYRGLKERVLSGKPVTNVETSRLHKSGEVIDVSISTAPLHDAGGGVDGVAVIYVDMRDRKVLEAQLRQAQKMEAVGQLAGGIAHDFNNLLTVIKTASDLLLSDLGGDDPHRGDVEEIEEAASRAASLTRQLLAFSRQQVLDPQVLDLNGVVAAIEPLARRLVAENITVATRLDGDLYPVVADRNQLDQVILNLVVNARDAMADGGAVMIETRNVVLDEEFCLAHPSAQPGPHVVLSVTDTGCGMDAETQGRIFEPFFTTKPVGLGTGLGLSTVYGIVKQSGGHIWVHSRVGRGSTFRIYLPGGGVLESEAQPAARPRPATQAEDRAGATILVVEDDGAVRSAVCRLLERRGYRVVESMNGRQALAALRENDDPVDLVISDIVMPEMSGLELRDRLREIRPAVPVLLMSGYSQEAITRLGNDESLGPLIEKPFTVDSLLENVRSVLNG
ncbi:MAG: PAS domain-containing protein [Gemmatimonadales bacterium]